MYSKLEKDQSQWLVQINELRRAIENGRQVSIIDSESHVVGDIECQGDLRVYGWVTGDVRSHTLIVEDGALIEGDVQAVQLVISGTVRGTVMATDIGVEGTAVVNGSIIHNSLTIEPGALLEGRRPWRPRGVFG